MFTPLIKFSGFPIRCHHFLNPLRHIHPVGNGLIHNEMNLRRIAEIDGSRELPAYIPFRAPKPRQRIRLRFLIAQHTDPGLQLFKSGATSTDTTLVHGLIRDP